jgi:putative phosphoesterase
MTRLAIFSDVHANLPALEAVLTDVDQQSADAVYALGDLVGYAPWPNEVLEVLERRRIRSVMGNYDDGTGFDRDECGCAYRDPTDKALGDQSFAWTKAHVTDPKKAYLRSLASEIRFELGGLRFLLVHGSPRRMNEYLFEDRPLSSFERIAADARADVIACGHTHRPYTKQVGDVLFVNVGSAGKPKDGDPRACYALLDVAGDDLFVTFRRVEYDLQRAAEAIRRSELPSEFAEQLVTARAGALSP